MTSTFTSSALRLHGTRNSAGSVRCKKVYCTTQAIAAPPIDNVQLKNHLLSHVAGLNRGLLANEDEVGTTSDLAKALEETCPSIDLAVDLDKLQGRWRLVYSSAFASGNLGGSRPGPQSGRFPLTLGQVFQRIDVLSKEFDNIVDLQIGTLWPLPSLEFRATLIHTFELTGGAGMKIAFDRTSVRALGSLSELPPLDVPSLLPSFLTTSPASRAQFSVTYLDEDFRITRGDRGELRVFVKL